MIKKLKQWKNQLKLSLTRTRICKVCYKEIYYDSFHTFINNNQEICSKCLRKLSQKFKEFKFEGINALAIYDYRDLIKEKIFIFKGCGDYELKNIFIEPFKLELKIRFKNYVIIPSPSYEEKNKIRGYNQVIEMFKPLNLEIIDCLFKKEDVSQHLRSYKERQKISEVIAIKEGISLVNKRVLLVDDIMTTGATLKTCINLLKSKGVKEIKIMVVAKRNFTQEEKEKLDKNYQVIE